MRAVDAQAFSNISATTSPFQLQGGIYSVDVVATFGGGTVKLQKLAQDNSTYVDLQAAFPNAGVEVDLVVGNFSAAGNKVFALAQGTYRLTIATATAVFVNISRIPGE